MAILLVLALLGLTSPLVCPATAQASATFQWEGPSQVSQGRAFVLELSDTQPLGGVLVWQGKEIPMQPDQPSQEGRWRARLLLGMPMDAKGAQTLHYRGTNGQQSATVTAVPVPWKEQRLSVEPKYVEPPQAVQERIARETAKNRRLIASIRPEAEWRLPFVRPVKGGISSNFGGRRIFNGQPRSPHRGTDLRGPTGTPIHAVAAGTVVLAEDQYFSGNVVYLDHGQGVLSLYAHLSEFAVKVGERVEQGQVIGKVGATGRVTGPHLHLGLMVQGVAVDAMPLFKQPLELVGGPTPEDTVTPAAPK